MPSKIRAFFLSKRSPTWIYLHRQLYSIASSALVETPAETNSNITDSVQVSAIRSLKNGLYLERLIHVLDSTPDLALAVSIFRWASSRRNFEHTAESYAHMVLKLGMVGDHQEMDELLKEMVKSLDSSDLEEAFAFLIESFCRNRRLEEALLVFNKANSTNLKVSVSTCNVLLGALASEKGRFQSLMFVYKEMVKVGILPVVETLNYLMKGLCDIGRLDTALDQFHRMTKKRCSPNSQTFEIVISGLCSLDRVDESVKVFNQMIEVGCTPSSDFYTSIIPLFCQVNRLEEGTKLFSMMKDSGISPDPFLYGVLIQCFSENLRLEDAVELFEEMIESGVSPMTSMYTDIVKGFCRVEKFTEAMSFLDDGNTCEIEPYNALLKGCCDACRFLEASDFLNNMLCRGLCDSLSWNILILGLCQKGNVRKAFEILGRMVVSGYKPGKATYSSIITGYCKISDYENALNTYRQMCTSNLCLDSESFSELIKGLCDVKKIQEAVSVFYYVDGKACSLTISTLNTLIQGLCLLGKVDEAIRIRSLAFCRGTFSTPETYSRIIARLLELELNRGRNILLLLSQILVEGCCLDDLTYCLLIRGLCAERTSREAALLFNQMVSECLHIDTETLEILFSCMINYHQLHMILQRLEEVMNKGLLTPTLCNIIIFGLLKEGRKGEACKYLDWMLEKGWVPDSDTHALLVGSISVEEKIWKMNVEEDNCEDKVSNILSEGLETSAHLVEEK